MMGYNGHKVWKLQVLWGKQHGVIFIPSPQKLFVERDESAVDPYVNDHEVELAPLQVSVPYDESPPTVFDEKSSV